MPTSSALKGLRASLRSKGILSRSERAPLLNDLIRQATPGFMFILFFTVIANLIRFTVPIYLIQVLDRVVASRSVETLVMLTVLAIAALVAGLALEVVRQRMLSRLGFWLETELAPVVVKLDLSHNPAGDGDDATGLRDHLGKIGTFVSKHLPAFLDVLFAPLFLLVIFLIHPLLGLLVLTGVAMLTAVARMRGTSVRDASDSSRGASRQASRLLADARRNRESVVGLAMAPKVLERWEQSTTHKVALRKEAESRTGIFTSIARGVGRILRIAVIGLGVWLFLIHQVTLGGIFAARILAGVAYNLVERAARSYGAYKEARLAFEAVNAELLILEEKAISLPDDLMSAPFHLDEVSFRYRGQRTDHFKTLSICLEPGELLLVSGRAETGKTTLARLLVGLLQPTRGVVRLGEVALPRIPLETRSRMLGYLPQQAEIFSATIRDNISRYGDRTFEEVVEAAKVTGVHDTIVRLREGYDTRISAEDRFLSGSVLKRIAIARAIAGKPRLLVLDEPMANLDAPSRRQLEAALGQLKSSGATVIVTQAMDSLRVARLADRILDLNEKPHRLMAGGELQENRAPKLRRVK